MSINLKPNFTPKIVLGIAAHPDDLDFSSSGSFSKWASSGAKIYYLILTDGSKGSNDPKMTSNQLIKIRESEQKAAAKTVGAKDVFFLKYPDGMLEITMDLKKDICRVIRRIKPDTVVTMDPSMLYELDWNFINHPDHRAAGQAAIDCVFPLCRDRLTFPELLEEGLQPHKVRNLLLVNFNRYNYVEDIGKYIETKKSALKQHASQMKDVEQTMKFITERSKIFGEEHGHDYAERFVLIEVAA